MRVAQAQAVARQWVTTEGAHFPGFAGAFLQGSVLWAPPEAEHPADSDVDVMLVLTGDELPPAPGKFWHNGVLLEVSVMRSADLDSPEAVLSDYHLAGNLHLPGILADPAGRLTALHTAVAEHFADRRWTAARCTSAMNRVRAWLTTIDPSAPLPEQVTSWLFGTGVMTHVLLVAGLRNPTVRHRYVAVRGLLQDNGMLDYHEHLLQHLGSAGLNPDRVLDHLHALETVFDAAKAVAATYRFSSDITELARPIAIDGSRDITSAGLHREAMFWILATYCRCLTKLSLAGASTAPYENNFHQILIDLGVATSSDRRAKADRTLDALPELANKASVLRENAKQHHA